MTPDAALLRLIGELRVQIGAQDQEIQRLTAENQTLRNADSTTPQSIGHEE